MIVQPKLDLRYTTILLFTKSFVRVQRKIDLRYTTISVFIIETVAKDDFRDNLSFKLSLKLSSEETIQTLDLSLDLSPDLSLKLLKNVSGFVSPKTKIVSTHLRQILLRHNLGQFIVGARAAHEGLSTQCLGTRGRLVFSTVPRKDNLSKLSHPNLVKESLHNIFM